MSKVLPNRFSETTIRVKVKECTFCVVIVVFLEVKLQLYVVVSLFFFNYISKTIHNI